MSKIKRKKLDGNRKINDNMQNTENIIDIADEEGTKGKGNKNVIM